MDKPLSRDLLFDFKNGHDCIPSRLFATYHRRRKTLLTALQLSIGVGISKIGPGSRCGSDERILLGWLVGTSAFGRESSWLVSASVQHWPLSVGNQYLGLQKVTGVNVGAKMGRMSEF